MSLRHGQWAENVARGHLESNGLSVVARNYRCRRGELDLVCLDGPVMAFVEVRYRRRGALVDAIDSIDAHKIQKLRTTALYYLSAHREHAERMCRFDVVTVSGPQHAPDVDWIKDAFE